MNAYACSHADLAKFQHLGGGGGRAFSMVHHFVYSWSDVVIPNLFWSFSAEDQSVLCNMFMMCYQSVSFPASLLGVQVNVLCLQNTAFRNAESGGVILMGFLFPQIVGSLFPL